MIRHNYIALALLITPTFLFFIVVSRLNLDTNVGRFDSTARSFRSHKESCTRFFVAANCSSRLGSKGKRHQIATNLKNKTLLHDFRNVLLIIHYNKPAYDSASKTYAIYKHVFADVVFCGPSDNDSAFRSPKDTAKVEWTPPMPVHFVPFGSVKNQHQMNPYKCLSPALLAAPGNYSGVLLASDDVILNFWNWKVLGKSLDKIWVLKLQKDDPFSIDSGNFCNNSTGNLTIDCPRGGWMWPSANARELAAFYDELQALANGTVHMSDPFVTDRNATQWTSYWRDILTNLTNATGGERRLLGNANGDMFYIGRDYLANAVPIISLLGRHKVFLEIAVVTAMRCVASNADVQTISLAGEDWGNGPIRSKPIIDSYRTNYEMVHPFKLGDIHWHLFKDSSELTINATSGDIDTTCVYCNLIKLSNEYLEYLKDT